MNLFIDTNVYLTFYHYTNDTLEELKKLEVAIKRKEINLFVTNQIVDEFNRNRENKIADALKRFSDQKLNNQFPQICRDYIEYKKMTDAIRVFEECKDKITNKLIKDAENYGFGADKLIADLMTMGTFLHLDEKIFSDAKLRMDLGNPPGKEGSYGDAVNWELLLNKAPNEDFYMITDDKDYKSKVDENKINPFLLTEWSRKKKTKLLFFRKLSDFLGEKYPKIKMADELEKEIDLSKYLNSGQFFDTHNAIARLKKYSDFTDEQINRIVIGSCTNKQIYWIREDEDVKEFLGNIYLNYLNAIEKENLELFKNVFKNIIEDENYMTF